MRTIPLGTLVFDASGSEYVYKGRHEIPGMSSYTFDLRNGGTAGIHTDLDTIAPVEALANVNLKDPRITVTKMPEQKPRNASGPWLHDVELPIGVHHTGWHKTKRDAIAESAHRLAIADWHEVEEEEEVDEGWFPASKLLDALKAEGVEDAWVWQSGGGTATIMIPKEDGFPMLIGPGSYHWTKPSMSLFTMDELSYGLDHDTYYERNGLDADEPENYYVDPETSITDAAKQIVAKFRELNPA
jgi:hypothetical protein